MERDWLPGVIGLLGVLLGGTISSISKWIELRYQQRRERAAAKMLKLEDLHIQISALNDELLDYVSRVNDVRYMMDASSLEKARALDRIGSELSRSTSKLLSALRLHVPSFRKGQPNLLDGMAEMEKVGYEAVANASKIPLLENQINRVSSELVTFRSAVEAEVDRLS